VGGDRCRNPPQGCCAEGKDDTDPPLVGQRCDQSPEETWDPAGGSSMYS
jgi:hypothetical protein